MVWRVGFWVTGKLHESMAWLRRGKWEVQVGRGKRSEGDGPFEWQQVYIQGGRRMEVVGR